MYRHALVLLALALAGCETDPPAPARPASVPVAGPEQRLTANGEIRSVHSPYAVSISKLNYGDRSLSDLSRHGLPVMVVFANLSTQPVSFGPEDITVSGGASVLTAQDIQKLKEDEESSNNTSSIFDALVAAAGAAQAGQLMHAGALTQMQATAVAQGYATLAVSDIADNNAQNEKIEQNEATLVEHYQAVVLEETTVGPHQMIGGMVFVRHANAASSLTLDVQTGDFTHHFTFVPPDMIPAAPQASEAAQPQSPPAASK
jgi:hypothetical protein